MCSKFRVNHEEQKKSEQICTCLFYAEFIHLYDIIKNKWKTTTNSEFFD